MIRFISDLHLSENQPEITARFLTFLKEKQSSTSALYILGDFFEVWMGDDLTSPLISTVQAALRTYHDNGIKTYFMAGNRDFLVGPSFCSQAKITLLPEPYMIELNQLRTVLLHGDVLCTQDKGYQRLRAIVRTPWIQTCFLLLPLSWRKKIALHLRENSRKQTAKKSLMYMDASETALVEMLEKQHATQIIHGHTHHLAIHTHMLKNNQSAQRFVLGDWKPNQGNALCFDGKNLFFEYF